MTEGASWLLFGGVALLALVTVAADGRLMALDDADAPPGDRRALLVTRREGLHRALAGLRLVLFIAAGAALPPLWHAGDAQPLLGMVGFLALVATCEVLARALGGTLADRTRARWLDTWTLAVGRLLAPLVQLGERIERLLATSFPAPPADEAEEEAVAEQFLEDVAEEADVRGEERAILHGVFSLGSTTVQEIMTPRVDIIAVERETPWSELLDKLRSSAHSRLPVYKDTVDDVLGTIHLKDILGGLLDDEEPEGGWQSRIRPAYYIPPTKPLDALLREFRQQRRHLAIVLDEYGGTTGLVTIEDVLEEVVGEIEDEHDDTEEDTDIESRDGAEFWVRGRVTLDELSDALGVEISSDEVTTVGGLIYERLGRVPRAGERLEIEGHQVVVEKVRRRQVQRVYFRRPTEASS